MKEIFKETIKTVYSHKNGSTYTALGIVRFQLGTPEERHQHYALYVNSKGEKFIRELNEFHDGRFTKVKEDNTEYSITEIGRVVMLGRSYGVGEPPVLHYTGFDVIDATNANGSRRVCLAWQNNGPVFVVTEDTLTSILSKILSMSPFDIESKYIDPVLVCTEHKLGEHYYSGGAESILPLCGIWHDSTVEALINDEIKLYKFCPNCGKELIVRRTTVKNGTGFTSVFWDENLTEE